ncbi:HEAT repeat domain-containing protein [Stigmatella aurantiaca]|uniref:HEAT repeat domain-containing protein n=1 Tax=Stigmatella aurantiaca TaxID=41 RepID=UPI00030703AE|nr:hypothetical protein [Stigmatella aurantiaca]
MDEAWEDARRHARPDQLASLRRLEQALVRTGWRQRGKTPREWLSELVLLPKYHPDTPYPADMLAEAGLCAVPALVDALRTKQLDPRSKRDTLIRAQCVEVLASIEPPPTCAIPALLHTLPLHSAHLRRLTLWVLGELQPRASPLAVREILACLGRKQSADVRCQAARTLSKLEGDLPAEVRLAALQSLTDPLPQVRHGFIQILGRLPGPDAQVRTALEEQVILVEAAIDSILRARLTPQASSALPPSVRDERALRLLQAAPLVSPQESPNHALASWVAGFQRWGQELCVRIALAAARRVVELWDNAYPLQGMTREALFAIEAWLFEPSEETARRAVTASALFPSQFSEADAFSAAWATTYASLCIPTAEQRTEWKTLSLPLNVEGEFLGSAVHSACRALQGQPVGVMTFGLGGSGEPSRLSKTQAAGEIRRAIVEEVLPWILGTWDPVLDVYRARRTVLP